MVGRIPQLLDTRRYARTRGGHIRPGAAAILLRSALPLNDGERRPLEDPRHGRAVIRGAAAAFYWTAGLFAAITLMGYGQRRPDSDG
jgi:hypothetical protein